MNNKQLDSDIKNKIFKQILFHLAIVIISIMSLLSLLILSHDNYEVGYQYGILISLLLFVSNMLYAMWLDEKWANI